MTIAAWEAGFALNVQAQNSVPVPSAESTLITDLPTFWLEGVRDKVRPIKMEVLVNYYDPSWNILWVDAKGELGYLKGASKLPIQSGDRILVEGTVIPVNGISADTAIVTVLEHDKRSPPVEAGGKLSDFAQFKGRVVTFEAILDREQISNGDHLMFDLVADGYRIHALDWLLNPELRGFKQGSRIRVTGVYNANHNPQTESLEIDVWCGRPGDVALVGEPESDPRFNSEVVPIDALPGTYAKRSGREHIAGSVRAYTPGQSVLVYDETGAIHVQTFQTLPLKIGDWIEAVGEPLTGGTDWLLRGALIRRASSAVEAQKKRAAELAPPQLRLIEQALTLNPQEAAAGHPIEIVGVVLWSNMNADFMYVADTSGAIRVQLSRKLKLGENQPRYQLRIAGYTRLGAFAPEIVLTEAQEIDTTLFPATQELTLDQAMTGLDEGRRISLRGRIQRVVSDGVWSRLIVSTQRGTFTAVMDRDETLADLQGSIVSVRGVCSGVPNARRQLTSIEILLISRDDIQIEQAALADPFTAPLREIGALRQFNVQRQLDYWTRVRGVVTQHVPGRFVVIQDGPEGLMLLSEQTDSLVPGDLIEATGLPTYENGRIALRESVYRKLDHREQPVPTKITEHKNLSEELDSRLVTVRGNLINSVIDGANISLAIQSRQSVFTAVLPERDNRTFEQQWKPGAELELTGVYQLIRDEHRQPRSFQLQLRSPSDVTIVHDASWWTPARALIVTMTLIGCVALGMMRVLALGRRVTEQKDQLRVQVVKEATLEAHNRAIVQYANECIFTTDLTGHFTSFNPAGERLLGYRCEEILLLSLRDLIATEDAAAHSELIASLTRKDQPEARFELRLLTKDKRSLWVEISACLILTDGKFVGVLGVVRDIGGHKQIEAELKRARDAAQANTEAKSAFLANMSHEIRTPMNGVIGMSNLILDTRLSVEQREFAETIRNSAESLLTVLNDILDFSKIEAGKLHFEEVNFDLAVSMDECLELLSSHAAEKQIDLSLFIPPDLPRLLKGDPGRLRQVLLNLVGNALKFTNKGEVAISVSAEHGTAAEVTLRFEVRDTGVGIAREDVTRLFKPFSQADISTTRRFGGTGLGLAISKQIVQLMQGEIGVTSELGHGSMFWFTARLGRQAPNSSLRKEEGLAELAGLRLLAVDDHAPTHRIVRSHASHWGMRSHAVETAAEALDALSQAADQQDPYRVVLLDCQLPEVDGLVLAATIRADRRFGNVALVMLTWSDRRISSEDVERLTITDVITKPLHTGEFLLAIKKAVMPPQTDGEKKVSASPIDQLPVTCGSARLLVAEDNAVNQRLILHQLKKLGYNANLASNGMEVLRALEVAPYDLILMDCQMPELDGYETTRAIRRNPRYSHLRIVAMTANAMLGDREKCLAAGMDDYLAKPTRINELRTALIRCLSREDSCANGSSPS